MSELTEALRTHGQQHRGADLGGVLQWAALHIAAQRMGAHSTQAQTAAYIRNKKAIKSTATR